MVIASFAFVKQLSMLALLAGAGRRTCGFALCALFPSKAQGDPLYDGSHRTALEVV